MSIAKLIEDLTQYQAHKTEWEPYKYTLKYDGDKESPQYKSICRALHFADLETQVKVWDKETIAILEHPEVSEFFAINALDEDNHDVQMHWLSEYFEVPAPDNKALELKQRWYDVGEKTHPVTSMYVLECGFFFLLLPNMMRFSDVYTSNIANWISGDEVCHVKTNRRVMHELGLTITSDIVKVLIDTIAYVFEPMGAEFVLNEQKRALKRLTSGKDESLSDFNVVPTTNFFEQRDKQNIPY